MLRAKLSVVCTWWLATALLLSAGCSSNPADKEANWSPAKLYSEAKDELGSGAYEKAISLLERLEGRAAGTPLAQQAQLDKAYAQYKSAEPAQAVATLDRFMKLHPASPALDYALYLKGLVNFNDNMGFLSYIASQDLAERDQKASKDSFEAFKELVTRFPASRYTPDAKLRMTHIVNSLANYELHVARYYLSRGAYLAAANRAQLAVTDYPDVAAGEEALANMIKSYDALGLNQRRDDTKRVLEKNHPKSEYLSGNSKLNSNPWWKLW